MSEQFSFWFITGLITALLFVVWYAFSSWQKSLDEGIGILNGKIDDLIETLKDLGIQTAANREQMISLTKRFDTLDKRLSDHGERIRSIELGCAKNHSNVSGLLDVSKKK